MGSLGSKQVNSFGSLQVGREEGNTLALAWEPTPGSVLPLVEYGGTEGEGEQSPSQRQRSQRCLCNQEAQAPPPGSPVPHWPWDPRNSRACRGCCWFPLPPPKRWTGDLNLTFPHRKPGGGEGGNIFL